MPFTQEDYNQAIRDLADTATPTQKGQDYPVEIQAFAQLADRATVELEAEGHPFKIYVNSARHKTEQAPLFINIHGGGWYIGHQNNDVYFAAWLAEQIGGVVVDVDYSTSDIGPWGVMFGQCLKAVDYAVDNAERLGCSPSRISIGGYSAGGHLTAGIIIRLIEEKKYPFALGILCYAPLDMSKKDAPCPKNELEARMQKRGDAFNALLIRGNESLREIPAFNPIMANDETLAQFPATLILTAALCPFRVEDEAFGARLASLEVETTMQRYANASHGFIPHFTARWEDAAQTMARYIKTAQKK